MYTKLLWNKWIYLNWAFQHLVQNMSSTLHYLHIMSCWIFKLPIWNWVHKSIQKFLPCTKQVWLHKLNHAMIWWNKTAINTTSLALKITIFITAEWYPTQFLQLIKNKDSGSSMLYQNTWKETTSSIWLKKEPEFLSDRRNQEQVNFYMVLVS